MEPLPPPVSPTIENTPPRPSDIYEQEMQEKRERAMQDERAYQTRNDAAIAASLSDYNAVLPKNGQWEE